MQLQTLPTPQIPRARAFVRWSLLGSLGSSYVAYAAWAHARTLPTFCPFRRLTGRRCPLCGLTTATGHLLHGDWHAAQRAHRFAPFIWLGALLWYGWMAVTLTSRFAKKVG